MQGSCSPGPRRERGRRAALSAVRHSADRDRRALRRGRHNPDREFRPIQPEARDGARRGRRGRGRGPGADLRGRGRLLRHCPELTRCRSGPPPRRTADGRSRPDPLSTRAVRCGVARTLRGDAGRGRHGRCRRERPAARVRRGVAPRPRVCTKAGPGRRPGLSRRARRGRSASVPRTRGCRRSMRVGIGPILSVAARRLPGRFPRWPGRHRRVRPPPAATVPGHASRPGGASSEGRSWAPGSQRCRPALPVPAVPWPRFLPGRRRRRGSPSVPRPRRPALRSWEPPRG